MCIACARRRFLTARDVLLLISSFFIRKDLFLFIQKMKYVIRREWLEMRLTSRLITHYDDAYYMFRSYNNCYYSSSEPVTDEEDEL